MSEEGRLQRIERLLEERNTLAREALAMQRSALDETREIVALQRANIERANEVNAARRTPVHAGAAAGDPGADRLRLVADLHPTEVLRA